MYKVIEDNQSEFFLEAIPKWITHFGFGLMITVFFVLLTITSFITYPQIITLSVNISHTEIFTTTDFDTYTNLKLNQEIKIMSPFSEIPVVGVLEKEKSWAKGKEIFIPINIDKEKIEAIPFKEAIVLKGQVMASNQTLLENIFGK